MCVLFAGMLKLMNLNVLFASGYHGRCLPQATFKARAGGKAEKTVCSIDCFCSKLCSIEKNNFDCKFYLFNSLF